MTPDWKGIRLDYSQGMTQSALQAKYGVAASTLRKRIRAEGWSRKFLSRAPLPQTRG